MPDDAVETVEEEDETKEDIEANTPPVETKPKPIDYSKYRRQFLHVPTEKIRKAFAATTQNAASIVYGPKANQTLKSPNPALNICRRKERAVALRLELGWIVFFHVNEVPDVVVVVLAPCLLLSKVLVDDELSTLLDGS